ncbi:hypothetical protein ABC766_15075 [Methylobacterium fujisawaense]|uniref:hypothetical protein n=1 Tax=Methylobacterium fujisawaense TaxID=107400 RepID=UPI0031F5C534
MSGLISMGAESILTVQGEAMLQNDEVAAMLQMRQPALRGGLSSRLLHGQDQGSYESKRADHFRYFALSPGSGRAENHPSVS